MTNSLLLESAKLAKAHIEQQSEPGRQVFENEAHDRQFIFQGNISWEQITLNLKLGRGWEKGMSLIHVLTRNEWKIIVGVDNGDGTTSHISYSPDGKMQIGLDKFSEPMVSPIEMRARIKNSGIPTITDLPKEIDFNETADLFLQQVQRGDFSNPQIISADRSIVY